VRAGLQAGIRLLAAPRVKKRKKGTPAAKPIARVAAAPADQLVPAATYVLAFSVRCCTLRGGFALKIPRMAE